MDLPHIIPRVLNTRGFDYWESGMDFLPDRDRFEAFVEYQTRLLAQFEAMAEECNFHRIDAAGSIRQVFQTLKAQTKRVLVNMKPIPPDEAKEVLAKVVAAEKDPSRNT
jgi:dTMP kinase